MEGRIDIGIARLERSIGENDRISSTSTVYNNNLTITNSFLDAHVNRRLSIICIYIASQARCIGFSVGRFAFLAANLSPVGNGLLGTACLGLRR
jgi:hypothetical protein